jgi:hypothetical protein
MAIESMSAPTERSIMGNLKMISPEGKVEYDGEWRNGKQNA